MANQSIKTWNDEAGIADPPRRSAQRRDLRSFSRSLARRFSIGVNRVEAMMFDLMHGTDTRGKAPVSELANVVGNNIDNGTGYQAVNAFHFRRVMKALPFPQGSVFVDIGCGKGKPLLLAAEQPFVARALGVEFAGDLCVAAARNALRYGDSRGIASKIEVLHRDALDYEIDRDENIFFLNNPFDAHVLSVFADKIEASIRAFPRKVWLLYGNPTSSAVLDAHPTFMRVADFHFYGPGRDVAVYCAGRA